MTADRPERDVAEEEPRERGAPVAPPLQRRLGVDPAERADVQPVERIHGEVGDEVIHHHPGPLPHRRVRCEAVEQGQGREEEGEVVRRVELALPARRRQLGPVRDVLVGFGEIFLRAPAVEPRLGRVVGVEVREEVQRGVVLQPVVLRVAPVGRVGAPQRPHPREHVLRQSSLPDVVDERHRIHPEHVTGRVIEQSAEERQDVIERSVGGEAGRDLHVAESGPLAVLLLAVGVVLDERGAAVGVGRAGGVAEEGTVERRSHGAAKTKS